MAEVSLDLVKQLRTKTGAGILDCRRALDDSKGDMQAAEKLLRERGFAKADTRTGRETRQGLVDSYIHPGNRVGAIVEINCETDFVARTEEFRQLAHDLAMQVAAMNPAFVNKEDVPSDEERSPEEAALMSQAFIKDPSRTIDDMVKAMASKTGENIRVRRFSRFELGG